MALAYFITFTTYGTRLHGSEKGSVDQEHNAYGTPFVEADAEREQGERETMSQPPYVLSAAEREIVCKAIVHVRSTHVHVVVRTEEREPGRTMSDLKARASRDLNRAGFDDAQRRRWARHGSTQHLFQEDKVNEAIHYTLDEQGERMAWYAKEPRTK